MILTTQPFPIGTNPTTKSQVQQSSIHEMTYGNSQQSQHIIASD
jgi:hypothetical protein